MMIFCEEEDMNVGMYGKQDVADLFTCLGLIWFLN